MMGTMGPLMMILWLVIALAVLGLAVAGAVWLVRSRTSTPSRSELPARPDPAQEELRQQYAAGKIGREEYLQRKIDLEQ
ncbi:MULTISPECIES: hypothetical protein [Streptomyces]|uniref:SHOCT domain-containing protein n=1 Tax=Streptomyces TaxID=1883 RepID=UPI0018D8C8A5|nr:MULTISPECIES: hypothetical protein [Streptomyces]